MSEPVSNIQRLYAVRMVVDAVVVATSELDAERVFGVHKRSIMSDGDYHPECDGEVKREADLPGDWDLECLPYGCAQQRDIAHWLDQAPPEVVRDTKTIDMFEGAQP